MAATQDQVAPGEIQESKIGVMSEQKEQIEQIAHAADVEDHTETPLQAIKRQPWAVAWCLYAIYVLIFTSFDNQAGGTVIGISTFRKDFGSYYDGNYVLPAAWQSAYSGGPVASAIIGSIGGGYLADRIGRKYTIALGYIFAFAGITLEMVSTTNAVFFGGKFLAGFAIGAFITVAMTYIGEIAPLALRGVLTAASAIAFTIGPLIVAIIVNYTGTKSSRWAYRATFVAEYTVSAIGLVFLPFMPESPWWLVSRNKIDKAAKCLHRLGYDAFEVENRLAIMRLTLEKVQAETEGVTYLECFRKSNLRRTIISIAPMTIQALGGVYFMAAYATYYMELAGYSDQASFRLTIVQQVLSMLGNITTWFIIDRVGRRNLTFWGMVFLTILLMITGGLAVAATPGAIKGTVALILLYCYFYNATIGATAYSLLVEVATARLRAKTASLSLALQNAIYTMWAFVIPYLFNPNEANLGAKVSFIFGGLAVLCTIYLWFFQPEVSGRSYEELDELFIKKIPARKFKAYVTDVELQRNAVVEQGKMP